MSMPTKRVLTLSPHTVFWLLTAYKAVAALVVLTGGVLLLAHSDAVFAGLTLTAARWADSEGALQLAGQWMGETLAKLPRSSVTWTGLVLLLDGALLALTAVALARRSPAARTLVLTAILLPILPEVYLLARQFGIGEVVLLLCNALILAYVWRFYPRAH